MLHEESSFDLPSPVTRNSAGQDEQTCFAQQLAHLSFLDLEIAENRDKTEP